MTDPDDCPVPPAAGPPGNGWNQRRHDGGGGGGSGTRRGGIARTVAGQAQGASRTVVVSGTVIEQTGDGNVKVRTQAGEVSLKTPTPLPQDRQVTLQIPPGNPPMKALVFMVGPPLPQGDGARRCRLPLYRRRRRWQHPTCLHRPARRPRRCSQRRRRDRSGTVIPATVASTSPPPAPTPPQAPHTAAGPPPTGSARSGPATAGQPTPAGSPAPPASPAPAPPAHRRPLLRRHPAPPAPAPAQPAPPQVKAPPAAPVHRAQPPPQQIKTPPAATAHRPCHRSNPPGHSPAPAPPAGAAPTPAPTPVPAQPAAQQMPALKPEPLSRCASWRCRRSRAQRPRPASQPSSLPGHPPPLRRPRHPPRRRWPRPSPERPTPDSRS